MVPPSGVVPSKKDTFVTLPSESCAVAVMGTTAGAVNEAPSVGDVIATVGPVLPACTFTTPVKPWIVHEYGKVPALGNAWVNVSPLKRTPESHSPELLTEL